ncbi:MAG TPA: serine/threonine-protein kinase [Polyangiaceae bacterium]
MQSPSPTKDDLDSLIGSVVAGKYRIERVLGRGGMGAVFSATNTTMGKRVALKFLTREAARDKHATLRFQREAEAAGVIESEHIVHVFDSGTTEEGLPFLVMELLNGEDLRMRLQREGLLPVAEATEIATQILRGLVRAHAAGIIHRDLKPDNVFLSKRDDGSTHAKIVDFGISKLSHGRSAKTLTRRGTVLGTAYYMAPEQATAAEGVDHRADLYGVGTILFEMLAGRPPHMAPTHEAVLVAICTKDAPDVRTLRPDTPSGLARLLERALARDRDARIGSAEEFVEGLGGAPGPATAARALTAGHRTDDTLGPSTTERHRSGNRRTVVGGVVAALLGFTLTAALVARKPAGGAAPSAEPARSAALSPVATLPAEEAHPPGVEVVPLASTPLEGPPAASAAAAPPSASKTAVTRPSERRPPKPTGAPDAGVGRTLTLSTREP